jgi:hypothetical protein
VSRLISATARELRVTERTDPARPSTELLCTKGTAAVTYTLGADGTLRYASGEAAAGNPRATLRRTG